MYDTIIVGAGCAGLAAAMYAGRLNIKVIICPIGDEDLVKVETKK